MNEVYEWAVAHINEDGTEVGVEELDGEQAARDTLLGCASAGMPCSLMRRPVSPWLVVE